MKPLSEQLAELSVQAKNIEDRARRAQSEAKERLGEKRSQLQQETSAALDKVSQGLARVNADAQTRARQLKAKVESDVEQLKQRAAETGQKFEAWQAGNYADDKEADAAASVDYAIAAVKIAGLAVIDAIDARLQAGAKEQIRPAQPTPA